MTPRNLRIIGLVFIILSIIVFWIPPIFNYSSGISLSIVDWTSMILGLIVDTPSFVSMIAPEKALSAFGNFPATAIDPILSELSEVVSNIERVRKDLNSLKISKTDTLFASSTIIEGEIDSAIEKLQIYIEELDEIKGRLDTNLNFYENVLNRSEENESTE